MGRQNACDWCGAIGRDIERVEVESGTPQRAPRFANACCVHAEHAREKWTDAKVQLGRSAKSAEQTSIFDVLHEHRPASALNGND